MTSEHFPNALGSVAQARHLVREELQSVPQDARDSAEMMVSEVVTNVVRHTTSDFLVTVELEEGVVRIEVTDWGGGDPVVRNPEPTEPNGRGLQIVDMLSHRWGIAPASDSFGPGGGKTVWFELILQSA
jgi:anti-sigma regulatory factor (Ser/Thr protein kinase)